MRPSPTRAVVLVVLDSVGVGGAPDAAAFGDEGSATLPHVAEAVGGLELPNLRSLGLGNIVPIRGVDPVSRPAGAFGRLTEVSAGKDTTTGHWELSGVVLDRAFPTYPSGFPAELIAAFESAADVEVMGNEVASGTEIIERLGSEHVRSGRPIVYTSADSVFQIAAHVDVVPLERLYAICRIARGLLRGEHEVGRVIARPFEGAGTSSEPFRRTPDRHDFSVEPPADTILDLISGSGMETVTVGKVADIFAGRGVTSSLPTRSNDEGITTVVSAVREIGRGLVFANLVDFDQSFGHRNDPDGYARALGEFDLRLPEMCSALGPEDVLILTADHGNDPTTASTDHSREQVPLLVAGDRVAAADLGTRSCFADCGATILDLLDVPGSTAGASFAPLLRTHTSS